tara:strand:- start:224 stop:472 length:249 start_codon:yes stop_codon:yes gene_type:complete
MAQCLGLQSKGLHTGSKTKSMPIQRNSILNNDAAIKTTCATSTFLSSVKECLRSVGVHRPTVFLKKKVPQRSSQHFSHKSNS